MLSKYNWQFFLMTKNCYLSLMQERTFAGNSMDKWKLYIKKTYIVSFEIYTLPI